MSRDAGPTTVGDTHARDKSTSHAGTAKYGAVERSVAPDATIRRNSGIWKKNMTIRSMRLAYPVRLETEEGSSVLVSFPDIPEALTEGATEQEALTEAEDCLLAAPAGTSRAVATFRSRRRGGSIRSSRCPRRSPPRSPSTARCASAVSATRRWPSGWGTWKGRSGVCSTSTTGRISAKSKRRFTSSDSGWWWRHGPRRDALSERSPDSGQYLAISRRVMSAPTHSISALNTPSGPSL